MKQDILGIHKIQRLVMHSLISWLATGFMHEEPSPLAVTHLLLFAMIAWEICMPLMPSCHLIGWISVNSHPIPAYNASS